MNDKLFDLIKKKKIKTLKKIVSDNIKLTGGIDLNIKDRGNNYTIHYASMLNDNHLLKFLIERHKISKEK